MSAYLNQHKTLSLRHNFSWTLIGNLVYAASQWGMLVAIARLGTPAMVGEFSLGLALTSPIILFSNLQLRNIQANDAVGQFAFKDYFILRLITTVAALSAVVGLVATGSYAGSSATILIVALAKSFESVSDVYYGLFQQHERMDAVSQSLMLRGLLSLAALSAGLYVTASLVWGIVAMTLCWAAVLLLFDIPYGVRVLKQLRPAVFTHTGTVTSLPKRLSKLALLATPLGITMLLISLNTNVPRYFLEHFQSTYTLGIFSALAYVMVAGKTVVTALGQAAGPRLAKHHAAGEYKAFRSLAAKLIATGALLGFGGVAVTLIAGRPLLRLLYGAEYSRHNEVFVLLMVATGLVFVASFMGYIMTAARYFKVQAPLFAAVLLASCLACWGLIPGYGLTGAALASVISAATHLLLSALVCVHIGASLHKPQSAKDWTTP